MSSNPLQWWLEPLPSVCPRPFGGLFGGIKDQRVHLWQQATKLFIAQADLQSSSGFFHTKLIPGREGGNVVHDYFVYLHVVFQNSRTC